MAIPDKILEKIRLLESLIHHGATDNELEIAKRQLKKLKDRYRIDEQVKVVEAPYKSRIIHDCQPKQQVYGEDWWNRPRPVYKPQPSQPSRYTHPPINEDYSTFPPPQSTTLVRACDAPKPFRWESDEMKGLAKLWEAIRRIEKKQKKAAPFVPPRMI